MLLNRTPIEVFGTEIAISLLMLLVGACLVLTGGLGGRYALRRFLGGWGALAMSVVLFINMAYAYHDGARTVTAFVDDRRTTACHRRSTCYTVVMHSGERFELPQAAYERIQIRNCYRISYYNGFMSPNSSFIASIAAQPFSNCRR